MNLLIVDDERLTRECLLKYIDWTSLGFSSVFTASNGLAALDICQAHTPDIVLTDIMMPKMDGITFCKELRKICPDCEIIFLSGYPQKDNLMQALHLQAVDFLEKPLDVCNVTAATERAIKRLRQRNPEIAQSEPDKRCGLMEEIQLYIQQNLGDKNLTAKRIAEHFWLSQNYFCTLFKRKTNSTPKEYITKLRMEKAAELLAAHRYKQYEIAAMVGYTDSYYFTRVFQRRYGVTPSQYREGKDTP